MLDVQEVRKLDGYLKKLFGNAQIRVVPKGRDNAEIGKEDKEPVNGPDSPDREHDNCSDERCDHSDDTDVPERKEIPENRGHNYLVFASHA